MRTPASFGSAAVLSGSRRCGSVLIIPRMNKGSSRLRGRITRGTLRNRHAAIEQRGGDGECSGRVSAPAGILYWLEARELCTFQANSPHRALKASFGHCLAARPRYASVGSACWDWLEASSLCENVRFLISRDVGMAWNPTDCSGVVCCSECLEFGVDVVRGVGGLASNARSRGNIV